MFLCKLSDIEEDASKGFALADDQLIFAVKKDGVVSIYENSCPHLGIPLEMMPDKFLDIENYFIQCSTHGALFETDTGLCVAGPCKGASLKPVAFELKDDDIHLLD